MLKNIAFEMGHFAQSLLVFRSKKQASKSLFLDVFKVQRLLTENMANMKKTRQDLAEQTNKHCLWLFSACT